MWWLAWWRPPCLLRTVIVNRVDSDISVRGVLWSSRGAWLTLKECAALRQDDNGEIVARKLDGDVVIHRSKVAFLQVV